MEKRFDDLDIALYHLMFIGNAIERTFEAFNSIIGKVAGNAEHVFFVNTSSMILILAKSFLDEYNGFVKSDDPELMATITNIKTTVKPAIRVISQWKDRGDFRNQVLAHNLRGKENESVFERGLTSYDIPQQGADLHVFVSCIGMVKEVFESAFTAKLAGVQAVLDKQVDPKAARRYDAGTFEAAIEEVRVEINENIRKLKVEQGLL